MKPSALRRVLLVTSSVALLACAACSSAPPPAPVATTSSALTASPRFAVRFLDSAKYVEGEDSLKTATGVSAPALSEADVGSALAEGTTVRINLKEASATRFGEATKANVGRRMAILVDGKVQAAPILTSEVDAKHFEISLPSAGEATRLAYALSPN